MRTKLYLRRILASIIKCCILSVIVAFTATSLFPAAGQQQLTVTGSITDEKGDPLPGVNVVIKGTALGVVSNVDGRFSIAVPSEDAVLVFSFMGYAKQEMTVGSQRTLEINMAEDTKQIDEVVVTGYGTQKKATLTGAVSMIKNQDIVVTKNENVVNMLSGKVPGLRITQRNSRPGDYSSVIDIRGYSTANSSGGNRTTPLFVIDGVPRDQAYFSRMDPEEIDNISVLKDASAAIYGMRAANGVILVTTKGGADKEGKADITYSGSFSWQKFIFVPERLNAADWYTLRNESTFKNFNYNNFFGISEPEHPESTIAPWRDGTNVATDWMDLIFNKLTPQTQHNVTVSGGGKTIQYFISLGYAKQDGAFKSGSLWADRINFRTNLDAKLTNRLKARVALAAIFDKRREPRDAGWTTYKNVLLQQPISTAYANNDPRYLNVDKDFISDGVNSLAQTSDIAGYNTRQNRRMNGALTLTYDIPGIKGLQAKAFFDYSLSLPYENRYGKAYTGYTYNTATKIYTPVLMGGGSYNDGTGTKPTSWGERQAWNNQDTNMQFSLNYNNKFGDHSVNGILVFEEQYSIWDNFQATRFIPYETLDTMGSGIDDGQKGSGSVTEERSSRALAGQFNYDYAGKYLLGINFRYEGSSRWPKENRWGFFPSVALGWRISEEGFIKNNFDFISNLKLRASYGKMGDDAAASNYPEISYGYSQDGNYSYVYAPHTVMPGVRQTAQPNLKKTWYSVTMKNIGLDFSLFRDKLSGTFELFSRDRDGLLATSSAVIPGTVGASLPQENLNADRVYGWEIELAHRNRVGEVSYDVSIQVSGTQRKLTKWQEEPASNSFDHWRNRQNGRVTDIWWGREAGDMLTNINDIRNFDQYPLPQGRLPGDWYFVDWNGDGIVNDGDQQPIATKNLPLFNGGLSLGASWKGIDISILFQGSYRVYTSFSEVYTEALPFGRKSGITQWLDRWRPVDINGSWFSPDTQWIEGYYPVTGSNTRTSEGNNMLDASYIRLKNLELGYTLPQAWMSKVKIKSLRVYVSGYNLATFSHLNNIDPERPGATPGVGASTNSVDMYSYPNNQTFTVGLNLKF